MNELTEKRTPEQIGAEIRMYYEAGRRVTLLCGIEIGRRLAEAKELLKHGEWLPWLEKETAFSERHAQRYMKLFDEYGAAQLGLFGPETNATYMSDFPISKALALLSVPESDRIEFAEEVDAEHLSVRELEEKIREREELLKTQDGMLAAAREEAEKMKSAIDTLAEDRDDLDRLRDEAEKKLAEAQGRIRELESRPVEVAVETVRDEAAIKEAAEKAREKTVKEYEKTVNDLNKKLLAAEKERSSLKAAAENSGAEAERKIAEANAAAARIRAELEEAQKMLKTSAADVTAFGIRFNTLQGEYGYLIRELGNVLKRDPDTGKKLTEAARQLLGYFTQELEKLTAEKEA